MAVATVIPLRSYMADIGPRVLANGYSIIPIRQASKAPSIGNWVNVEATPELVRRWGDMFPQAGIGILTARTPAIDLDILDPELAGEMTEYIDWEIGFAPERIGNPPKRIFLFRNEQPFRKLTSPAYRDGEGRKHQVEALGDGQQFVGYGVHPTGRLYQWSKGFHPLAVPAHKLPCITPANAHAIFGRFRQCAEARGWERLGEAADEAADEGGEPPDWQHKRARIESAMDAIPEHERSDYRLWLRVGMAVHYESGGSDEGFELWDEWSSAASNYDDTKTTVDAWASFKRKGGPVCRAATIYHYAKKLGGWRQQQDIAAGALAGVDPSQFQGYAIPERRWLVPDWIPLCRATGLYGAGGEGKTQLAQMLATACALGQPWVGLSGIMQCRSLLLYCEDDLDEMLQRQAAINRFYGCDFADLGAMLWLPRLGEDNSLMTFNGRPERTPLFDRVLAEAKAFGARLVIADTLADVFAGNENDRTQARAFAQQTLAHMARELEGAVVTLAHPSRAGIRDGTGESGSTAWEGTFRSRLYLATPRNEERQPVDPDLRVLTRMKANNARRDEKIELRWRDGVLVPTMPPMAADDGPVEQRTCEAVFLALLEKMGSEGQYVSHKPNAGNYAARLFALRPEPERFTRADYTRAMHNLFGRGLLVVSKHKDSYRRPVECLIRNEL